MRLVPGGPDEARRLLRARADEQAATLVPRPGYPIYGLTAPALRFAWVSESSSYNGQWTSVTPSYGDPDDQGGPRVTVTTSAREADFTLAAHREVRESARTGQRPQHPPDWGRMHNALWQRAVSERRRIAGAGAEAADADVTSAVNHLGQLLEHAPWFEADARLRGAATAETVRYAMLGETVPSLRAQRAWAAYWDAHLSGAGQASPIEPVDALRPLLDYWLAAWDAWTATA